MFEQIDDFNIDIDSFISILDKNTLTAKKVKHIIDNYQKQSTEVISNPKPNTFTTLEEEPNLISFEDEVIPYIRQYHNITFDNLSELTNILPNQDDYQYNEILLRLCTESLKEIKNCEELKIEEGLEEDPELDLIIETEKQKIKFLKQLLEPIDELTTNEPIQNKIILMPNSNDSSILKDIEHIPSEYYNEVSTLLESIINNTFKKFKRFKKLHSSYEINGFCEVRGKKIRIIFKRLNNDTYAIITIFMKKTTTDNGYRDFVRNKINTYISFSNYIKNNLNNPNFLLSNASYLEELFNKLGMNKDKGMIK